MTQLNINFAVCCRHLRSLISLKQSCLLSRRVRRVRRVLLLISPKLAHAQKNQVWSGILFCLFARFVSFAAAFAVVPLFILWLFILFYFLALWLPLKWILSFSSPAGQNMSLLFSLSSVLFAIKLSRFVKYMSQANARAAALCARLLKCAAQREGERDLLFLSLSLFVCVWSCHKMLSVSFTRRSMPESWGCDMAE